MAIKVKLRKKPISKGRQSLYLDVYPGIKKAGSDKITRREFLGFYIYDKPKNPLQKQDNKQNLLLAEQIRQKRHNEYNKPEVYTQFEIKQLKDKEIGELSFLDYYEQLMDKRSGKNYQVWKSAFYYLKDFTKGELKFINLDEKFCNDFKEFIINAESRRSISKKISQNTAHSYFNKFKATLKQAYKDGLIPYDLNGRISAIKTEDTRRMFLTLEELNELVKADCPNPLLKKAALFSSLTGLRISDIVNLKWEDITYEEGQGYTYHYTQKKTQNIENTPISEQAFDLLNTSNKSSEKVFKGLKYSAHLNNQLLKWVMNAGITKHITFHSFRHTYATLQLKAGTDLYTVSKMLGHRDLKTTQIYAKIVDETKRAASERIKLDL